MNYDEKRIWELIKNEILLKFKYTLLIIIIFFNSLNILMH